MYSHDSYGLGHFRRNLTIAEYLISREPRMRILAVTGSPRSHSFRLPHRFDYVKLPAATKDPSGAYVSRELDLDLRRLVSLRSSIVRQCAKVFDPDLVLVDHSPAGLGGELIPLLETLHGGRAKIVLGMRDIIDEPRRVLQAWDRGRIIDLLRRHYHALLLYGDRRIFDPIRQYRLPADLARRLFVTGYIVRADGRQERAALVGDLKPDGRRLVVVTAGGGGDGNRLLKTYLRGLREIGPEAAFASFLVTGPLMSRRKREHIRDMAAELPRTATTEFLEDLPWLYREADLVVSMGGYNTITEILDACVPALIVPRVAPRLEQKIRAEALAALGLVEWLSPDDLSGARLARAVLSLLERARRPRPDCPRLDGLSGTWDALEALAEGDDRAAAGRSA
jgi:predicted glycosyltransferase